MPNGPRKRFGQHFLTDPNILGRIADAALLEPGDTVIEIGPGRGTLTDALRARAAHVIAIEVDRDLVAKLEARYAGDASVSVVLGDVLETPPGSLGGGRPGGYVVVGNVPYYITTPIMFHVLACALPRRAVFLVQREVAIRAMADAGSKSYGALSVNLQVLAHVERVFDIPPGAFKPPPKVDSSVIRVTPLTDPVLREGEQGRFRSFVQSLFSQRRKQIGTILRSLPPSASGVPAVTLDALAALGIPPTERPERLTPLQFVELFRSSPRNTGIPD